MIRGGQDFGGRKYSAFVGLGLDEVWVKTGYSESVGWGFSVLHMYLYIISKQIYTLSIYIYICRNTYTHTYIHAYV